MNKTTFYHDKSEKFIADLEVEGTSINKTQVRMLLEFSSNHNRLYYGTIDEEGHVEVNIPKLNDINETEGKATLEVIAENSFFSPWSSTFEIKKSKEIKIKEAKFTQQEETKVIIKEEPIKKEEIKKEVKLHLTPLSKKLGLKETVSKETQDFIRRIWERYQNQEFAEKTKVRMLSETTEIQDKFKKWGDAIFLDTKTNYAKTCMYLAQVISQK